MTPRVLRTIAETRAASRRARAAGETVGLVPTMGALHAGHAALLERARRECGRVVVSVFVNAPQFNQAEDFERYPRMVEADVAFCGGRGVDWVFAPSHEEMYPREAIVGVDPGPLAEGLCGAFRPGHFRAVATVVAKLFQIVEPDRAYFGEKDYQQLIVIRRMAADLNFAVEIAAEPTVREPDGTALSSRNARLNAEERRAAAGLYRALSAARTAAARGETAALELARVAREVLDAEPLIRVEYVEAVDAASLRPLDRPAPGGRMALAAWIGETRLIDNVELWSAGDSGAGRSVC